jgi:hypothetical protein
MSSTIDDVISQARERGVSGLPEPSHLSQARVWPTVGGLWVAEVGEPPRNTVVGSQMHASKEVAIAAALAHIMEKRSELLSVLPADLVGAARSWPEPTINEWDA